MNLPLEELDILTRQWIDEHSDQIIIGEASAREVNDLIKNLVISSWHSCILTLKGYDNKFLTVAQRSFLTQLCEELSLTDVIDSKGRYCIISIPRPRWWLASHSRMNETTIA